MIKVKTHIVLLKQLYRDVKQANSIYYENLHKSFYMYFHKIKTLNILLKEKDKRIG
jgi:hypothetical protein